MNMATEQQVAEALDQWSQGVVLCRCNGHSWRAWTASHSRRYDTYEVVQRCSICNSRRVSTMDSRGYSTPWRMVYADGYLLKNKGRIDRSLIRFHTIRSYRMIEVDD